MHIQLHQGPRLARAALGVTRTHDTIPPSQECRAQSLLSNTATKANPKRIVYSCVCVCVYLSGNRAEVDRGREGCGSVERGQDPESVGPP